MHRLFGKLLGLGVGLVSVSFSAAALAQEVVKIGFIGEMSGPFAGFCRQMQTGIRTYQKQYGDGVIGTGDITYEASLKTMGGYALDMVTVYPYSAAHKSALNTKFVRDFVQISGQNERPAVMGVSAYDGMAAICGALMKIGGKTDGELENVEFETIKPVN